MHYDLIIVGGGLVGVSLALALRETSLRIALIDARVPINDDPRLFALNDSSCQLLKNINVWTELQQYVSPIHQVHVSHRGYFGSVKLNCKEAGLSSLGHVIPARYIESVFNARLKSQTNLTLYQPAKLKILQQQDDQAILTIETAEGEITLQAPLIIGADGADSTVRTQLHIATEMIDCKQSAIVTRTVLQRPHQQIAYERFTANGAIAMLPLLDNECATIWSADQAAITELMTLDDTQFLQKLQRQFGYRLGRLLRIQQRHVMPLRILKAKQVVNGSVFLLGNAAHTLHPIAAQGFNLALYEVATLVEGVMAKLINNEIFTAADLQIISEKVQKHCNDSLRLSHRLSDFFSSKSILMNVVLQFGMIGLDMLTPIKLKFIRGIMGRINNVPRLLLRPCE